MKNVLLWDLPCRRSNPILQMPIEININAYRKPVSCRGEIQELTVIQC